MGPTPDAPMPAGTTIYSVADAAGVSIATVSRVVQGTGAVSERTRTKVLDAIERLDYMPTAAARSLAVRQHEALGLVLPELTGPYFSELLMGFEETAAEHRLSVVLSLAEHGGTLDADRFARLAATVDGIAVLGGVVSDDALRRIARQKPLLVVAGADTPGVDRLSAENTTSSAALTAHLVDDHGRTRPVFVGDPDLAPDVRQRFEGFRGVLEARRIAVPDPLRGGLREEDGLRAAERLLADGMPADAVVCANDEIALALTSRLAGAGVGSPRGRRRHRLGRRHGRPLRPARAHDRAPAGPRAGRPRRAPPPPADHRRGKPAGREHPRHPRRRPRVLRLPGARSP